MLQPSVNLRRLKDKMKENSIDSVLFPVIGLTLIFTLAIHNDCELRKLKFPITPLIYVYLFNINQNQYKARQCYDR